MGWARRNGSGAAASVPLQVVILDHTAALGGAELALLRLLDQLSTPHLQVRTILFSDGPLVERLLQSGHHVETLPLTESLAAAERHDAGGSLGTAIRNGLALIPFVVRLGRRLRELSPDVIHTTSLKADLIGVPASWIARRPLVWHIHDRISPDYLPPTMVRLIRSLARHAPRHVIVNSKATAATLPGVAHVTIAYPGFSADQVGPAERTAPSSPVVGILGRISPTKGQLEFVRAAARVLRTHPQASFRLIGAPLFGEDAYAAKVRDEVESLGIGGQVEFTGFVDDPAAALDELTVCVHASGQPEPFGQVIVEAMIRGVPVIATRGGGVTEIVQPDPETAPLGWLVPPHDVIALADAVVEALNNPALAEQRAQAALLSALERFPVEKTAAVVSAVWRSVSATPQPDS